MSDLQCSFRCVHNDIEFNHLRNAPALHWFSLIGRDISYLDLRRAREPPSLAFHILPGCCGSSSSYNLTCMCIKRDVRSINVIYIWTHRVCQSDENSEITYLMSGKGEYLSTDQRWYCSIQMELKSFDGVNASKFLTYWRAHRVMNRYLHFHEKIITIKKKDSHVGEDLFVLVSVKKISVFKIRLFYPLLICFKSSMLLCILV